MSIDAYVKRLGIFRQEYTKLSLLEEDLLDDPFKQFKRWFADAAKAKIDEPNAMTLATSDAEGRPHARIVLLKKFDSSGFTFFTNYKSNKAQQLKENPYAELVFYWPPLHRQVRITGRVKKLPRKDSEAYFKTRPKGSQLGAWASQQSDAMEGREELEQTLKDLTREYRGKRVPCPAHWGGYRLTPSAIEFWQGRRDRLHDRIKYTKRGRTWRSERLAP